MAAEHNNADAVVHYGHSCLSTVDKLPVYYVFDKFKLDLDHLAEQTNDLLAKIDNRSLILLYDVSYTYLYGTWWPLSATFDLISLLTIRPF